MVVGQTRPHVELDTLQPWAVLRQQRHDLAGQQPRVREPGSGSQGSQPREQRRKVLLEDGDPEPVHSEILYGEPPSTVVVDDPEQVPVDASQRSQNGPVPGKGEHALPDRVREAESVDRRRAQATGLGRLQRQTPLPSGQFLHIRMQHPPGVLDNARVLAGGHPGTQGADQRVVRRDGQVAEQVRSDVPIVHRGPAPAEIGRHLPADGIAQDGAKVVEREIPDAVHGDLDHLGARLRLRLAQHRDLVGEQPQDVARAGAGVRPMQVDAVLHDKPPDVAASFVRGQPQGARVDVWPLHGPQPTATASCAALGPALTVVAPDDEGYFQRAVFISGPLAHCPHDGRGSPP